MKKLNTFLSLILLVFVNSFVMANPAEGSDPAVWPDPPTTRPPNVVLILADDLGYGELGSYGQQWIQTPHLDRIASEGVKFSQFYSGQAVCAPSRCSLLTGMHQGHAEIRNNGNPAARKTMGADDPLFFPGQNPISEQAVTIAEILKKRGYRTAAIGKWGLGYEGSSGDPNRQGFDLFYGFNCQRHAHNHYPRFLWRNDQREMLPGNDRTATGQTYSQDRFTEVALEFIDENRHCPFFLYLPFAIPHLAIQAPESSLTEFGSEIPEAEYQHRGYIPHPKPRAGYAAMISHMDRDIGKIMQRIEKYCLEKNTIVIFTSDNGPAPNRLGGTDSEFFRSAGPLRGRKGSLYEGGIRVPLLVSWPGRIQPGRESDHVAAFWDLFVTISDLTGCRTRHLTDGISLAPTLLQTGGQREHDYLYWEFPAYGGQQAIRQGDYKAIRTGLLKNPSAPVQLYHLGDDIAETKDIAREHPELVEQLTRLMKDARTPSTTFPFAALDTEAK
ncbi:MAG: arylsulfatase [Mariniblastus sp.]|nr:arylsulfatase [Mariniblastus sp.]